jgi:hypothetical protein
MRTPAHLVTLALVVTLQAAAAPPVPPAPDLPARWDELTASAWPQAMEKSARTCILPIGILEKHGPHAPMGSDIIHVRELAARVTKQEYASSFPSRSSGRSTRRVINRGRSRSRPTWSSTFSTLPATRSAATVSGGSSS